jgi:hypothetical protein
LVSGRVISVGRSRRASEGRSDGKGEVGGCPKSLLAAAVCAASFELRQAFSKFVQPALAFLFASAVIRNYILIHVAFWSRRGNRPFDRRKALEPLPFRLFCHSKASDSDVFRSATSTAAQQYRRPSLVTAPSCRAIALSEHP